MVCLYSYNFRRAARPLASCFRTALSSLSYFRTFGRSSSESESLLFLGDRAVFARMRSRCFRTRFRSFCRAFFTLPVGVTGGIAGALDERGVCGGRASSRAQLRGGGVSTELRGVVAGLLSSSRRAGIWWSGVSGVAVRWYWTRCLGRAAASVTLGQPSAVAPRLISHLRTAAQAEPLPRHLPGQSGQQPAAG